MKKISISIGLIAGAIGLSACGPVPQTASAPNNGIRYPSPTVTASPSRSSASPSVQTWWAGVKPYHQEIGGILEAMGGFAEDGNVSLLKSSCVVLADQIRQATLHVRPAPDAIVSSVVIPYEHALTHLSSAASACQLGNWSTASSELGEGTSYLKQATAGVTEYTNTHAGSNS